MRLTRRIWKILRISVDNNIYFRSTRRNHRSFWQSLVITRCNVTTEIIDVIVDWEIVDQRQDKSIKVRVQVLNTLTMSTRRWLAGDGGDARRVLADLDFGGLLVDIRDGGGAAQVQPSILKHVGRHLEVYRRFRHLRVVVLRNGQVSRSVYHAVVRDLKKHPSREAQFSVAVVALIRVFVYLILYLYEYNWRIDDWERIPNLDGKL